LRERLKHILRNRTASSTVEYVIVIASAAALAFLLFVAVEDSESTIKESVIAAIEGNLKVEETQDPGADSPGNPPSSSSTDTSGDPGSIRPEKPQPAKEGGSAPPPPAPPKDHQDKGWVDKASELPLVGGMIKGGAEFYQEKIDPFVKEHIEPWYNDTIGPYVTPAAETAWDFVDPSPALYEMFTGKDWDTGEELSGYDRYIEPALGYLALKKVGKGGQLLGKVDDTITGGKVTDWTENISDPILKKRDDFVEWACGNRSSAATHQVQYASTGIMMAKGSPSAPTGDSKCLAEQILGKSDERKLQDRVDEVRSTLPSKLKRSGNMGIAKIDVEGLPDELFAHSRINKPTDKGANKGFAFLRDEENWTFKPKSVDPDNARVDTPKSYVRKWDSEFKILNEIAYRLGDKTNVSGEIDLFTERLACASCSDVIMEFRKRYPNIELNVHVGKK